jgi:hypothetical protein
LDLIAEVREMSPIAMMKLLSGVVKREILSRYVRLFTVYTADNPVFGYRKKNFNDF